MLLIYIQCKVQHAVSFTWACILTDLAFKTRPMEKMQHTILFKEYKIYYWEYVIETNGGFTVSTHTLERRYKIAVQEFIA